MMGDYVDLRLDAARDTLREPNHESLFIKSWQPKLSLNQAVKKAKYENSIASLKTTRLKKHQLCLDQRLHVALQLYVTVQPHLVQRPSVKKKAEFDHIQVFFIMLFTRV